MLPFENLGSPEDDYFADGIADAVRGKLTSLPGLEVIARGSSTPYKKTTKTQADRARSSTRTTCSRRPSAGARGAARIAFSSARSSSRSASGAPASKWQQPFDAALTDVFQVQSDIASRVAQALGVALGAGEEKRLSEKPTQNLAAYDAFLKGEAAAELRQKSDPASLRKALGFYEQAVALDPGFAQAWARVSVANSLLYGNSTPHARASRSVPGRRRRRPSRSAQRSRGYPGPGKHYQRAVVLATLTAALELLRESGSRLAPGNAELYARRGRLPMQLGSGTRRWSISGRPSASILARFKPNGDSATRSCVCGAIPRRGRLSTVASPSRPPTSL